MKRTNSLGVIAAFLEKREAANSARSLWSNGVRLYSYQTEIAGWCEGKIRLNRGKYSAITSKQQTQLAREIRLRGLTVENPE